MRQQGFHSIKNGLIVEFLHTSNVIGTAAKPMDDRRSIRANDMAGRRLICRNCNRGDFIR